jgi:hypothetical protein
MLLRFLSYLSVLVWCAIAKGFFNLDEEFVVFLCLIIVFSTGIAALSNAITEYSSAKVEKLLGIHSRNWSQLLVILKKVKSITGQNKKLYNSLVLLTAKAAKTFINSAAHNVVYSQMFYSLLVKEVFFVYENAEIKASSAYVNLLFKNFKQDTLHSLQSNPVNFSFNTFTKVFAVLKAQSEAKGLISQTKSKFYSWDDFLGNIKKNSKKKVVSSNSNNVTNEKKVALPIKKVNKATKVAKIVKSIVGKKDTKKITKKNSEKIEMPKLDKPAAPFVTLSDVMRKMAEDPSYVHPAFIFEGDKAVKKANRAKKKLEEANNETSPKKAKNKKK